MTGMAAVCIASMVDSLGNGNAFPIVIHPIIPNRKKYNNKYECNLNTQEEFSKSEKFLINFKLYQLWHFTMLKIEIYPMSVQNKWKQYRTSREHPGSLISHWETRFTVCCAIAPPAGAKKDCPVRFPANAGRSAARLPCSRFGNRHGRAFHSRPHVRGRVQARS